MFYLQGGGGEGGGADIVRCFYDDGSDGGVSPHMIMTVLWFPYNDGGDESFVVLLVVMVVVMVSPHCDGWVVYYSSAVSLNASYLRPGTPRRSAYHANTEADG